MADLEQVTREVWSNYVDLNTTNRIYLSLIDSPTYAPLRIVAFGRQGSGKTTFLYYAVKVAFARYLCHKDKVTKSECLDHAMKTYGLCLGRDCPRDPVDDKLMPGFYLTINDLLERFLRDVSSGEIARRRVVFFDDAFVPRLWWNLGGEWRVLYHTAKVFDQFYRDHINVLVLTAPNPTYFTKDYILNSLVLQFNAMWLDGDPWTLAYHYVYPHHVHYDLGKPYLVKVKKLDYIDKVLIRRPYGMPKWLEELNTARRQYVLRQTASKALQRLGKALYGDDSGGGEE